MCIPTNFQKFAPDNEPMTGRPLPLGPVHIAGQDVLILSSLLGFGTLQPDFDPWRLLQWYFAGYLASLK